MKMIKKTVALSIGLVMMGGATSFAQSLADARKAIDAEQYQKATSMLKTLVSSQAKEGDNYYYLGNVYMLVDEPDSAKAIFTQGTAAAPKNALNYVGLGQVALYAGDASAAKNDFDKAIDLGKKDYTTYMQIGRAYFEQPKPDYAAALPFLQKADELDAKDKDAYVFVALGDYWASQENNTSAYEQYLRALDIDPNLKRVKVQIGRMFKMTSSFPEAEAKVKEVIDVDPNYGPAYRELAEINNWWSLRSDPTTAADKHKAALENMRKYLDLTDRSFDSRFRYAQFLVYAGDWATLATELNSLNVDASNPRAFVINRLKGYSAVENQNFDKGVQYLTAMFGKSDNDPRILASDYIYLGKAYMGVGNDSLAVLSMTKGVEMDTTKAEELAGLAKSLYDAKKYDKAGPAYKKSIELNSANLNMAMNYYYMGLSYYFSYAYAAQAGTNPSKDLLVEADTAFSKVNQLAPAHDIDVAYLYRAYIGKNLDNAEAPEGLAVPHYLKYIETVTVTHPEKAETPSVKNNLINTYNYLGSFYSASDKAKAIDYLNKTLTLDPQNAYATQSLKILNTPSPSPKK